MWQLRRPATVPTETPAPTTTPGPLAVFMSGGVHSPSMYEVTAGTRVGDALAKAGGLLADADQRTWSAFCRAGDSLF